MALDTILGNKNPASEIKNIPLRSYVEAIEATKSNAALNETGHGWQYSLENDILKGIASSSDQKAQLEWEYKLEDGQMSEGHLKYSVGTDNKLVLEVKMYKNDTIGLLTTGDFDYNSEVPPTPEFDEYNNLRTDIIYFDENGNGDFGIHLDYAATFNNIMEKLFASWDKTPTKMESTIAHKGTHSIDSDAFRRINQRPPLYEPSDTSAHKYFWETLVLGEENIPTHELQFSESGEPEKFIQTGYRRNGNRRINQVGKNELLVTRLNDDGSTYNFQSHEYDGLDLVKPKLQKTG